MNSQQQDHKTGLRRLGTHAGGFREFVGVISITFRRSLRGLRQPGEGQKDEMATARKPAVRKPARRY